MCCRSQSSCVNKLCGCECVGGGKKGVSSQGICHVRMYVILFYVFIYFYFGLCLVCLFYECDSLDIHLQICFFFKLSLQ